MPETDADRLRYAQENIELYPEATEQQARAAALYLGYDEESWEQFIPLLVAIDAGRMKANWLSRQTPEYRKSFREYMMNR